MMFSIQNYTTYSILSGVGQVEDWVNYADLYFYTHLGVCDKSNMSCHIEFQEKCKAAKIKPIFGVEFSLTSNIYNVVLAPDDETRKKEAAKKSNIKGIVCLFAKNEQGYKNLIKLCNISQRKPIIEEGEILEEGGYYYEPRIDLAVMAKYSEGLICLLPSVYGYGFSKDKDEYKLSSKKVCYLKDIFGDNLMLGITPDEFFYPSNQLLMNLSEQLDVGLSIASNAHYPHYDMKGLYEVVRQVDNESNFKKNRDRYPCDMKLLEVLQIFADKDCKTLEKINHSFDILRQIDYEIPTGTFYMPEVEVEVSVEEDTKKYLLEGFKQKYCPNFEGDSFDDLNKYKDQLPHEHIAKGEDKNKLKPLEVYIHALLEEWNMIKSKNFQDYFLIVRDACKFIDTLSRVRGFARGSAGGSIYSNLLDITKVDPIRHDLSFFRFMNPERNDIPDIDLDFPSFAKDALQDYLVEKYGKNRICRIGTFTRWKVVSAIKDIAKAYAYGIPKNDGSITEYSPFFLKELFDNVYVKPSLRGRQQLDDLLNSEKFKEFYDIHSKWIEDVVMPLQETVVNLSKHAAGTLITAFDIDDCIPIYVTNGTVVSQWKDRHCETRGFPKFDFLTVEAVDMLVELTRLIEETTGDRVPSIEEIPLDDEGALGVIARGETYGIFQLGTPLQIPYSKFLKPTTFDDIPAQTSLQRPGPMEIGAPHTFALRRNGLQEVSYDHSDLEPILSSTLGLLTYQEQIMKIATDLAGFTGAESDHLRKAIGKKDFDKLRKYAEKFVDGMVANGYDRELGEQLWHDILGFGDYGFNKSHAVGYALMSYYQAYLKSRYPLQFWCAVLTFAGNSDKNTTNIYQARIYAEREGIKFKFPSMESFSDRFTPAPNNTILWPVGAIKGLGQGAVDEICQGGTRTSFKSLDEMMRVCDKRKVRKNIYELLIKVGFFNELGEPHEVAEFFYDLRKELYKAKDVKNFDVLSQNKYMLEKFKNESYGLQVSSWKEVAPFHRNVQYYTPEMFLEDVKDGDVVFVGGFVEELYYRKDKRGGNYAKLIISDHGEKYSVMIWSDCWEGEKFKSSQRPKRGDLVEMKGIKTTFRPPDKDKEYPQVSLESDQNYFKVVWSDSMFE